MASEFNNVTVLHGKCYCGCIVFEATAKSPSISHCHCNGCREWTGGGVWSAVPCDTFKATRGSPKKFQRKGGPVKLFCDNCGTGLCNDVSAAPLPFNFTVAAGLLTEHASLKPSFHCQTATKVSWLDTSADEIPAFEGWPQ